MTRSFFCLFSIAFGIVFLFLSAGFCFGLEVDYPELSTGSKITVQTELPEYLKYVFDFGIFVGFLAVFLSLVYAGILYLLSPAAPGALAMAKDRVSGAISGLLILATLYLIMVTVNPQLTIFKIGKLEPIPPPTEPRQPEGVYFYNDTKCSNEINQSRTNIPDLGEKNRAESVKIVAGDNSYVSILYDAPNYWGKCQYISPNGQCNSFSFPFADSASVHTYSFSSKGDVHFFRNSFFSKQGGYFTIKASDIDGIYIEKLEDLKFTDPSEINDDNPEGCTVPENERDCAKWNENDICVEKKCPNLSAENISSVKIEGNYFVVFIYFDASTDPVKGPWSFCQEFPTTNDANREGPQQIKWKQVRKTGPLPNYIMIISVKQK